MVLAMCLRAHRRPPGAATVAFLSLAMAACGGGPAADPHNRDVPWAYGPTTGTSSVEHARGTGSEGGAAIAKGWQCRLQDGKHLIVQPYQLAASHPLFGKVTLSVGLFDQAGAQLAMLNSPVITAANATFTFDIDTATADRLWDLVFWYRKA
jgi:hypothetical protein